MSQLGSTATTSPELDVDEKIQPRRQPLYHVVLLDDDDHTYDYVIRMLAKLFGYNDEKAYELAVEVDQEGRAILLTTSLERAELKQEQIHGFGADPLIQRCRGSMNAILEPALDK